MADMALCFNGFYVAQLKLSITTRTTTDLLLHLPSRWWCGWAGLESSAQPSVYYLAVWVGGKKMGGCKDDGSCDICTGSLKLHSPMASDFSYRL